MSPSQLAELKDNEVTRKRLAKWMAKFCFRDSELENFHDRFTQDEMREISRSFVNCQRSELANAREARCGRSGSRDSIEPSWGSGGPLLHPIAGPSRMPTPMK
jgi:hypothetical protein